MTSHTYTNAEIVWPSGERTKSMRVEFREDPPADATRPLSFSGEIRFDAIRSATIGAKAAAQVTAMLRRLRAPRVCWKCHDGRTRAHNRRCTRRGRRTESRS
jgi:hypothetical protein